MRLKFRMHTWKYKTGLNVTLVYNRKVDSVSLRISLWRIVCDDMVTAMLFGCTNAEE
jgi:hypothetical protein